MLTETVYLVSWPSLSNWWGRLRPALHSVAHGDALSGYTRVAYFLLPGREAAHLASPPEAFNLSSDSLDTGLSGVMIFAAVIMTGWLCTVELLRDPSLNI
jgi:hypothetical protein